MEELIERGVGIPMLTLDYTEVLEMSHRIVVMRRGRICGEYKRGKPDESDILREVIGEVTNGNACGAGQVAPCFSP
jgi:ABC-type sugar transport system ATPase subunit